MSWRKDFLKQRPNKTIEDLKQEVKITQANKNLSKALLNQNQKERNKRIKKEVQEMMEK